MFTSFLSPAKKCFLLSFSVLFLLSGCGHPSAGQQHSVPIGCQNGSTTNNSGPAPLGSSVAFELGGCIRIQSESGFTCGAGPLTPPGLLVLPTVRSTYDQGTLQSVQNYVGDLYKNPGDYMRGSDLPHHRDTVPYPPFSADPQAFQLMPVSVLSPVRQESCDEFLQFRNISSMLLQITLASVILTADSQRNTQHYNLIEGCSLLSLVPGCEGSIGGGAGQYTIDFTLQSGKKNQSIPPGSPYNLEPNTFALQPGEVAEVILSYDSMPPNNFSFSLMPSLLIGQPGKQPISYIVSQLQETFAFALRSQISCYGLQGQSFVEVPDSGNAWCI